MKLKEVIEKLNQFDPEMEVCIFDHKYNLQEDHGEGTGAGVYSNFEIHKIGKEDIPDGSPEWVALSFSNESIDD